MIHAIVFLDTGAGTTRDVVSAVRGIEGVTDAYVIAGDFDAIVEIRAEKVRDVLRTVTDKIRPLDGVGTTRSYICLSCT